MDARIVNVILVEQGIDRIYFTLEGIEIGRFNAGKKVKTKPEPIKPKGGIVTSPKPKDIRQAEIKYNDEMMKIENRIPADD